MLSKGLTAMSSKKIEEKLTNRVLINFAYIIAGYALLYAFYLYAMGRIGNILTYRYVMCGLFVVLGCGCAVLYVLSFLKNPKLQEKAHIYRNYGHLALTVCLITFYVNLPFYTQWLPVETVSAPFRSILMFIKNTRYEYFVVAILMLVYLVFTIVYHSILINKFKKRNHKKA